MRPDALNLLGSPRPRRIVPLPDRIRNHTAKDPPPRNPSGLFFNGYGCLEEEKGESAAKKIPPPNKVLLLPSFSRESPPRPLLQYYRRLRLVVGSLLPIHFFFFLSLFPLSFFSPHCAVLPAMVFWGSRASHSRCRKKGEGEGVAASASKKGKKKRG